MFGPWICPHCNTRSDDQPDHQDVVTCNMCGRRMGIWFLEIDNISNWSKSHGSGWSEFSMSDEGKEANRKPKH